MDLLLKRSDASANGVFGILSSLHGGGFSVVTLEHAFPVGYGFAPALPPGVYNCVRRKSPHFGYDVFEVMNVPGHTYIEIHAGNTNGDSKGCVLLGLSRQGITIMQSRAALDYLMRIQVGIDAFTLVVE